MGFSAKNLIVKQVKKKDLDPIIKKIHYSGKVTQNSQLNYGVFMKGILIGGLQFGPPIDKRRMAMNLGCGMNEIIELNRLAIHDKAGKNSESRVMGVCIRLIKKEYPHIKCILSFSDATMCGDGIIYRAANFKLHSYKKNTSQMTVTQEGCDILNKAFPYLKLNPEKIISYKTLSNLVFPDGRRGGTVALKHLVPLKGYQMKYIYYIDKKLEKKNPSIPFDKIPNEARMYKGVKRVEHEANASDFQSEEGGSIPTDPLHLKGGADAAR